MLYKEWLNEWLDLYVKVSAKERTYVKYRQQVSKYITPALGEYELNSLTAVALQRFSVSLAEWGLSTSTVNEIISILKCSLRKGVSLGLIDNQFSNTITRPKTRAGKSECLDKLEQKKIEDYILQNKKPLYFGILLSLYSGLRIGELLALKWEDIDFQKGTISITKSCRDSWINGQYVKVFDTTKTESSARTIPLPRQIIRYMRTLKRQTSSKFIVSGKSEYGAQVRSYQRTFERVLKRLNIEHRGFHVLRHTFATRALEVGMDVKTLSEILGHQNPSVTLTRYAHSLMEHKTEMMNRVGKLLP